MKITIPKEIIVGVVVIGISIMLMPFFVFADEGHDAVVPHSDIVEVQTTSTAEDVDHFIGDGHTDHMHGAPIAVPWWQSGTWWVFFLISVFLIILLSFGVYKYLEDK